MCCIHRWLELPAAQLSKEVIDLPVRPLSSAPDPSDFDSSVHLVNEVYDLSGADRLLADGEPNAGDLRPQEGGATGGALVPCARPTLVTLHHSPVAAGGAGPSKGDLHVVSAEA